MGCRCVACVARRVRWSVRQLLPLTYRSRYSTEDGRSWFTVWRMWLGRCFTVQTVEVAPDGGSSGN